MNRAFTMIEVIFVIVIIGVLSGIAIPKLVSNINEADATVCVHESTLLVQELSSYYGKYGTWDRLDRMTNIRTTVPLVPGNKINGLAEVPATIPSINITSLTYVCNGESIAIIEPILTSEIVRGVTHNIIGLSITNPETATLQIAIIASGKLNANFYYRNGSGFVVGGN